MSQLSDIEWTDYTWNPTKGCDRISLGCKNCYAEKIAGRFSDHAFNGFAIRQSDGAHWTGKVELVEKHLLDPLKWRTPRRCFVNSMSDLFHENLPDESIDRIFAVMALTPHITYQILTKRAARMQKYLSDGFQWQRVIDRCYTMVNYRPAVMPRQGSWPIRNVHLGVSIENQPTADERISELLRTRAAVRFISYEPALEWVDLRQILYRPYATARLNCLDKKGWTALDWVIIGGESGPGARPFNLKWARDTIAACKDAGVPVFLKQLGSRPVGEDASDLAYLVAMKNKKGGDPLEWPPDLRNAREFPR